MAPAASAKSQGVTKANWAKNKPKTPKSGSTKPEALPKRKAFFLLIPEENIGIDTAAPSGTFCIAIPMARDKAAHKLALLSPLKAKPQAKPTAKPSGMLWMVTARKNFKFLLQAVFLPSSTPVLWWKCGMILSIANNIIPPKIKPMIGAT